MTKKRPSDDACAEHLAIALLPDVMRSEHVARALAVSRAHAEKRMSSGVLGHCTRLGKRMYITRDVFLLALRALAEHQRDGRASGGEAV